MTLDFSFSVAISKAQAVIEPVPAVQLCRLLHDCERANPPARTFNTDPIPEPFRASPDQTIPVGTNPALMSLLYALNPTYTHDRADDLLNDRLCWCNGHWGVFSSAYVTGGAVMEVERVEGGRVYVKSINVNEPIPTPAYVLSHHLSYLATSVHRDGRVGLMTRPFGVGTARATVRMFIIRKTAEPLSFGVDEVQMLAPGFEPREDWTP